MTIRTTWIAALGIALGVSVSMLSTAWAEDEANEAEANQTNKTCVWLSNIRDFRAIDNRHVWVRGASRKDQYLLTLFQYCTGIRFTETIALETRPSRRLCSNGNERLIVVDGSFKHRCLISDVERVEDIKAARELVKMRKEAKDDEDDSAAPDEASPMDLALQDAAD